MAYDLDPTKKKDGEDDGEAQPVSAYSSLLSPSGDEGATAAPGTAPVAAKAPQASSSFVNTDRYVNANKGTLDNLAANAKSRYAALGSAIGAQQAGVQKSITAGSVASPATTDAHILSPEAIQADALSKMPQTVHSNGGVSTGRQGMIDPRASGGPGDMPARGNLTTAGPSAPAPGLTQPGFNGVSREQAQGYADAKYSGPTQADIDSKYASLLSQTNGLTGMANAAHQGDYSSIVPGANAFDSSLLGTTDLGKTLGQQASQDQAIYGAAYKGSTDAANTAQTDSSTNASQWASLLNDFDAKKATSDGIKADAQTDSDAKARVEADRSSAMSQLSTLVPKDKAIAYAKNTANFPPEDLHALVDAAGRGDEIYTLGTFINLFKKNNPGQPVPNMTLSDQLPDGTWIRGPNALAP